MKGKGKLLFIALLPPRMAMMKWEDNTSCNTRPFRAYC
jgi:hypothetical protein